MPTANAETMSLHLDAISRKVAHGAHAVLVFVASQHLAGAPRNEKYCLFDPDTVSSRNSNRSDTRI
jgi:hypothetical protein